MSQHDEKPSQVPSPPQQQPSGEEPSSGSVYKFAAVFFGVPLILLLLMILLSN